MFGHRPDGKLVKTHSGLYLLMPHIMPHRYDSMNMTEFDVDLDILNEFIKNEKETSGILYSYFDILLATTIRTIYLRPELNRFVINKRIYQRNELCFSFAFQKSLRKGQESRESSIKLKFNGNENLEFIKKTFEEEIKKSKMESDKTDKLTTTLAKIPYFIMSPIVRFLLFLDKFGLLSKKIIDAEPFHTSFFITDLRSVSTPSIYHHVYEFGTTGLFLSTGIDKLVPYEDKDGAIKYKKVMPVKFVSDERFCDGFYFAQSLRMMQKMFKNPKVLLKEIEPKENDIIKSSKKKKK